MSSYLLCIGNTAEQSLPVIFTALSCGAALSPSSLSVFCLSSTQGSSPEAASLASDYSFCRGLMSKEGDSLLFPCSISFQSCTPVFSDLRTLSEDADAALLISALRGKDLPFSCQTSREAVEWCFADLLERPEDSSIRPFFSWLSEMESDPERNDSLRLTIAADLSDPFSAGIALVLLPFLRKRLNSPSLYLSLLSLAKTSSPVPESFFPFLSASLQALDSRSLLRDSDEESSGADAMWLLSLPSSMIESPESLRILSLSAARIIGTVCCSETPPPPGLHIREIDGTLSLASLRDQAHSFAAFLETSVWLVADLIPALRTYLAHPARLRSITVNPRNSLFRQLFSSGSARASLLEDVSRMESVLKNMLSGILSFLRFLPASLRLSAETAGLWQKAVNACGRYITVASELDTSLAEARESGLDTVRPVHRVSMADTEEERLLRRLKEMEHQLEDETRARKEILSSLGGYRSLQVRLDCLDKCRAALAEARVKAANLAEGTDHLTLMKHARRIRLLEAAVSRCETELDPNAVRSGISDPAAGNSNLSNPYDGTPLNPDVCRILEELLSEPAPEPVSRFPSLLPDQPDPDWKGRLRTLHTACRNASPADPFPFLLAQVLKLCSEETASLRFLTRGVMPSLPLLPDLISDHPLLRIKDLLSRLPGLPDAEKALAEQRGVLAMLVLRQYRRRVSSEAALVSDCLEPGVSPVLRCWLSANQADRVFILSLAQGDLSLPFALVLPGKVFWPARRIASHKELVPSFVTWFDRDSGVFSDPCLLLGEGDRKLLKERLSSYAGALDPSCPSSLSAFLDDFIRDLSREEEPFSPDPYLDTRLRAVCGLRNLSAYESSLSAVSCYYEHFLASDLTGSCLTGKADFSPSVCSDIPEDILYLYRGVPFAREDSRLLLADPHTSGQDYTLSRLKEECGLLSASSDDYRDALVKNLQDLTGRFPDALPENRASARNVLEDASAPLEGREPVFVWPWDPKSPSILTVLQESLGSSLSSAALEPFSDALAVFPARGMEIIGDTLLSSMCVIPPSGENPDAGIAADAVLPPLSAEFGRALCTLPEGRTLLKPGLLSFERFRTDSGSFTKEASDSFRVTLTLDGAFPVRFVREYSGEEILNLYSHDIPTVALWPSVPFTPEDWHAYYVYAHMTPSCTASVLTVSGDFSEIPLTSEDRRVAVTDAFPVCFSFSFKEKKAGILPNVLPQPLLEASDPVEICVDFGSSGTSVVFSSGQKRRPLQGPVMVRTLLNNPASSRDLLRQEFLPAVPVSALLPTVSRIFRNVPGASPVPFADGIILMSADLEDLLSTPSDAIYTSLKWEEEKGRSDFLCLHQIMLMAALQARCEGASAVSWRFSLPDEMAKEGRESLMNLFLSLSESVLRKSGYSLIGADGGLPVSFASESSALGAYFRFCAADDTRGGFMVLDLGACTADISLFLRGREQAVRTCQIPLGVHYMFLPSLLRDPELLFRDFGFFNDEGFKRDLSLLTRALSAARTDSVALRRARVSLDYFIADHLPVLVNLALQMASAGRPAFSGALLLLYLSYLMMLSGLVLLQLAADPNKNDFLPEQMALCLSGRGSSLLESLPPALKNTLWRFLSMFRNKRVSSLSLLFSAEKKMEIPVGLSMLREVYHMLPPASVVPASIAVRPSELLPEFLLRFRREFPVSSEMLFPGLFTNDYYHPFSARGEALISASIDQSFPPSENPRPYDSLSGWIGNLLDLVHLPS